MKKLLILLLALGTMSLSGCMEFVHGDHMGGDSNYRYGKAGSGHSH